MANLVHLTLDGEYITSYKMGADWYERDNLCKLVNTYPGHQAWCKNEGSNSMWHTVPVAGIGYSRWDGVADKDVPEVVRMAEIMR